MNVPWSNREWQRVLVYGLGRSGCSAARLLRDQRVHVVAMDQRSEVELDLGELALGANVEFLVGREPEHLPPGLDGIVVSPGIPLDRPLLSAARRERIPVIGEVELASIFLNGPMIAITGSNGKSTTTALTGALLEAAGFSVEVCGNIGTPLSSRLAGPDGRVFVVELSSFQLETAVTLHPRVAALLNISPDHLDRHGDLRRYLAAKTAIFSRQTGADHAVLNADDPIVRDVGIAARKRFFSRLEALDDGCYLDGESIVEVSPGQRSRPLFDRGDLALVGAHNLENAMAAALLARSMGAPRERFAATLATFRGLPHRMELVADIDGVLWLDDSKGTNVGATLKSLADFAPRSVHLILGGRGKGTDFAALAGPVEEKAAHVYLIGEAAAEISAALPDPVARQECGNLRAAVESAAGRARKGETVLLSPACASFDQYTDYAARGAHFKSLVAELGGQRDG